MIKMPWPDPVDRFDKKHYKRGDLFQWNQSLGRSKLVDEQDYVRMITIVYDPDFIEKIKKRKNKILTEKEAIELIDYMCQESQEFHRANLEELFNVKSGTEQQAYEEPMESTLAQPYRIEEIFKGCYLVVCPTQHELADLFMRFQEHYESPNREFRERGFSREEFESWYSEKFGNGQFTYLDDWSGFNIPGYILHPFFTNQFPNITPSEQFILDYFKGADLNQIYIIGVHEEDGCEALEHEKSHALFYLNHSYRFRVEIIEKQHWKELVSVRLFLRSKGYCNKVLIDETNAWLCFDEVLLSQYGVDVEPLRKVQGRLQKMYRRFIAERMKDG